jgi:hypothetical protein
MHSTYL